jgi:hypothetical protein
MPKPELKRVYLRVTYKNKERAKSFFKYASFQLLWDDAMRLWYVNTGLEELKAYQQQWKESPDRHSFKIAFR